MPESEAGWKATRAESNCAQLGRVTARLHCTELNMLAQAAWPSRHAARITPAVSPDAVVRRVATIPMVCVGAGSCFARHGMPQTPQDLARHNCLVFKGMDHWVFDGPRGRHSVRVSGNLASNTVETILSAVQAGVGIGMFNGATLAGDLRDADIIQVLEDFVGETRDVGLVWPQRKFVPARVRHVTEFFAVELAGRFNRAAGAARPLA